MSLYNKYRPKSLKEFYGNRTLIESLETVLGEREKIPHALLLTGASGCGKTTIARIVKDILNCHDMDYTELDAAMYRSIDDVRDIRRQMQMKPIAGPVRVWLLDECHMLGTGGSSEKNAAQNALLKALEDMPSHVYFILATTEPHMLLKTIKTRCMEFQFPPLSERVMSKLLKDVLAKEEKLDNVSDDIIALICKESLGSPRSALVALEKIIDLTPNQQAKAVERSASEENQAIELCRALIAGKDWNTLRTIVSGLQEQQAESVRRMILGYCQSVLLKQDSARAFAIIRELQYNTYDSGWPQLTASIYACMDLGR